MTTTRPPVARRCEDCGLVLVSAYRRCCPNCGGWMLTVSSNEVQNMEVAAGVTTHNRNQRARHNPILRECDSYNTRSTNGDKAKIARLKHQH